MAYLSLSSIMGEMRRAEADAQSAIDISLLNVPKKPEEPDPKLDPGPDKAKQGGAIGTIMDALSRISGSVDSGGKKK
jgi:hypothetical protein